MSLPASTLPELLQQLKRTFSPFERLRILGRAWILLRQMSPQERLTVAGQLGLDNADELVEAIAARSGTKASPALLSMIDQAQKKGTAHLPQLLSDLKDPGKRTERLRQGVAAAEAALVAEPAQAPWLPASIAKPEGAKPPPLPPPVPSAQQTPPIPVETVAPPRVSEPSPSPAVPPAAPAHVTVELAPPSPSLVHEKPPVAPAPAAPRPSPPSPPPPAPASKSAPEPPAQSTEAAPTVGIEPPLHLMDRFRQFRRTASDRRKLTVSNLRSLVEGFPDGWARRRALVELLRSGSPPALRDALSLLDILDSERDRLWCLGTLADRDLATADREALLAATPSPTARRRLERRMGER